MKEGLTTSARESSASPMPFIHPVLLLSEADSSSLDDSLEKEVRLMLMLVVYDDEHFDGDVDDVDFDGDTNAGNCVNAGDCSDSLSVGIIVEAIGRGCCSRWGGG